MSRPFDPTKFRKNITKSIDGISAGFHDPDTWVSTGNYCLNYLISGDFDRGIPLGKVTCFAGESGAGKSYIAAGNLVRNAQAQGIFVILLDSENALDEAWLKAVGVDTAEDKLMRISISMVDEVASIVHEFIKDYKEQYASVDQADRPKVMFVVDSLGMLSTPTDTAQFERGDMKGDMGRKPKALAALVRATVARIAQWNIGFIATNHTYASQDMFDPDDKISGGQGFIYASSIVVAMKKLKLKLDEDGNKVSKVNGIRAACKVTKSRYAKPFEQVKINIPYDTGMDPYSGMFDMLLEMGILTKSGNSYIYISPVDGVEVKKFQKAWNKNDGGCLDKVTKEFVSIKKAATYNITEKVTARDEADSDVDPEESTEEETE